MVKPMVFRVLASGAVTMLLLTALSCVIQAPSKPRSATGIMSATIENADSGQPLSNVHIELKLFPPEYGSRKALSLLCVPSKNAKPLFVLPFTTDPNGSFSITAPGGDYLAMVTIPQRQPIFGCIFFDTVESVRACGVDPSSLHVRQHLFVRTLNSIPGFQGDMLSGSACAAYQPSQCDPLRVPNLVQMEKVVLRGFDGSRIRDARLKFYGYTKGKGKLVDSLMTDANGVADVSSLETGATLRMSVESKRASGEFLIQFIRGGTRGQQTIKLFHWRCRSKVIQGAMVRP